jgi:hypothetical protein
MSLAFYAGAMFTLGAALIGWWAADRLHEQVRSARGTKPLKDGDRP